MQAGGPEAPVPPGGGEGPPAEPAPARWAQPEGYQGELRLPMPPDKNLDRGVVEIDLEAKVVPVEILPGQPVPMWTYNGTVPGPHIRLKRGDRLVINFTNNLPEPTTIHWHGLRIPIDQDGVPGHSQLGIRSGGSFRYDFVVPDAGLFWFHPHHNSAAQVGSGLYGSILVEDPGEPSGFGDEVVMQLSDVGIDTQKGTLRDPEGGGDFGTLFGREGDVLLVNGKRMPTLRAQAGLRQRWRVVNSAKSRYFQLELPGHKFLRIGGDGGLIPEPVEVDRPVLVPGERADLIVVPTGEPGSTAVVRWIPYDRGYGSTTYRPAVDLMKVELAARDAAPASALPPLPPTGRKIEPLDLTGATDVQIKFTANPTDTKFLMGVNGRPFGEGDTFQAKVGETQIWTIDNALEFAHPFHLHGFFFQMLDDAGVPIREWKDTADLPANYRDRSGKVVTRRIRMAVRYEDRPGMWMFHCHILDHAEAGMSAMLELRP